ncbi:UNVERIFIED_ORG: hypothetical protein J2W85_005646 [Ensifer adhaerens]|nr:hypothetical protein [Ensifer adhaerens]
MHSSLAVVGKPNLALEVSICSHPRLLELFEDGYDRFADCLDIILAVSRCRTYAQSGAAFLNGRKENCRCVESSIQQSSRRRDCS